MLVLHRLDSEVCTVAIASKENGCLDLTTSNNEKQKIHKKEY